MTSSDVDEDIVGAGRRHAQLRHLADTHSLDEQPRSDHLPVVEAGARSD